MPVVLFIINRYYSEGIFNYFTLKSNTFWLSKYPCK